MEIKDLMAQLKGVIDKFNVQTDLVKTLEDKINGLEQRVLETHYANGNKPKYLGEWDNEKQAKRFVDFMKNVFTGDIKQSGMSVGTDADGGFLVPEEFVPTLIRLVETFGLIRRSATIIPMTRDELTMPNLASGLIMYWPGSQPAPTAPGTGEGVALTNQKPQFGQIKLIARKGGVLVPATSELLEDSTIPIANLLATLVAEAFAKGEDKVGLVGDITVDDGETNAVYPFNGVLTDATNEVDLGATLIAGLTSDNLLDVTSLIPSSAQDGAKFIMHRTVFDIVRKLKDSNGDYIYDRPSGVTPGTIWGYPYELNDVMPSANASLPTPAGMRYIAFGNLKHYFIGDRRKMSVAMSTHVGFKEDEIYFRYLERVAMKLAITNAFSALKATSL